MSVTISSVQAIGDYAWIANWSSDLGGTPTFYVYIDGVLAYTTLETSGTFSAETNSNPMVEVLDVATELPETAFPARVLLAWFGSSGTDYYLVEEYVASVWTERGRMVDEGLGYYKWLSRPLEDVTTHQFRITPVGTNGNSGSALTFSVFMVRHGDPPEVTYTYSSGDGKVTIAAS